MTRRFVALTTLGAVLLGCTPPQLAGDPLSPRSGATAGSPLDAEKAQCSAAWRQTELNLMAWDKDSRKHLAALQDEGVVVVRYHVRYLPKGCSVDLEILSNCRARGTYSFRASPVVDHLVIHNQAELYANLPLGAVNLEGTLKGSRAIRDDYMLAGFSTLPAASTFGLDDLEGAGCERATHVVSRIYLGGFARSWGEARSMDAAASFFGAEAGVKNQVVAEQTRIEGNPEACRAARSDGKLHSGCDIPLEIGLLPVEGVALGDCQEPNACTARCQGGDAESCNTLGVFYAEGRGVARDPKQSVTLYQQACQGGSPAGCVNQGRVYLAASDPATIGEGLRLLRHGCERGDAVGCMDLGAIHEQGKLVPQNAAYAMRFFEAACQAGEVQGCSEALRYYLADCNQRDANGCHKLGQLLEEGRGTPADGVQASQAYQQSCDLGVSEACLALAKLYLNGAPGLAPDLARGAKILIDGCSNGQAPACLGAATMHLYGRGAAEDPAKARQYFQKACNLGEAPGCTSLANLLIEGLGGPTDFARARQLTERSCDANNPPGCFLLGRLHEEGKGGEKDLQRAATLYRRFCESGGNEGCLALRRLGVAR